jgi:hypothetical protein
LVLLFLQELQPKLLLRTIYRISVIVHGLVL